MRNVGRLALTCVQLLPVLRDVNVTDQGMVVVYPTIPHPQIALVDRPPSQITIANPA